MTTNTETQEGLATAAEETLHTLTTREIRPLRDWLRWLDRWQEAKDFQEMLGLLHVGYQVPPPPYDWKEYPRHTLGHEPKAYHYTGRHEFYLKIAEGWDRDSLLRTAREDDHETFDFGVNKDNFIVKESIVGLRRMLAVKAFEMLCGNLFKTPLKDPYSEAAYEYQVWHRILSEPVLSAIQHLFRVMPEERWEQAPNLPHRTRLDSHNGKQVVEFLSNLTFVLWTWQESHYHHERDEQEREKVVAAARARIETAKLWMIEVLAQLGHLDVLRPWLPELSKPCLNQLKAIAMRTELSQYWHQVHEDRKAKSLDEACFAGSKAAWLLKEHELMTREGKRLNEIYKLENQERQARHERERLSAQAR